MIFFFFSQMTPECEHLVDWRVLQVRHLPPKWTADETVPFLLAHGALTVAAVRGNQAFATFKDEGEARRALSVLHQLQLENRILLVTFARSNHKTPLFPTTAQENRRDGDLVQRIHSIAPCFDLDYILNPMVRYSYPPLADSILANICSALKMSQEFYTQVLHLMNKLNLQAPFQRRTDPSRVFMKNQLKDASTEITSESGSDLSDEDRSLPRKRSLPPHADSIAVVPIKKTRQRKNPSIVDFLPKKKPKKVTECFELKTATLPRIQLPSLLTPIPKAHSSPTSEVCRLGADSFGKLLPASPVQPLAKPGPRFNWSSAFTAHESLERISKQAALDHPAFQRYEEGDPCVRLYVKNIAKQVTEEDLFLLFGRFVPQDEAEKAIFDIRLMKNGRMRGQAFITFGSVGPAGKALEHLNRIVLKGKPIVIQFAKSGSGKPL